MIVLKDINEENWEAVVMLKPESGKHLQVVYRFVDSASYSMVWASMDKNLITKAIYNDDELIGFVMYGYCNEIKGYKMFNFFIDIKHQGKGYGKMAFEVILYTIKKISTGKDIYLTFHNDNERARKMYISYGFENTGKRFRLPSYVIKDIYGNNKYDENNDEYLYILKR